MLAVCESCLPTLSKLRESVSGLQGGPHGEGQDPHGFLHHHHDPGKAHRPPENIRRWRPEHDGHGHTTLDWLHHHRDTGTSRVPLAPPGSQAQVIGTLHLRFHPAESQCFIRDREDRVETPASSTPLKPREPWSVVCKGAGARPSPPPPPPGLPLDNRFDLLSLHDFPPVGAFSSSPPGLVLPVVVALNCPGARVDPSSLTSPLHPGQEKPWPGASNTSLRLHPCRTSRQPVERRTPSVLVCRDLHGQARGSGRRPDLLPPWSPRQPGRIRRPQAVCAAQLGLHTGPGGRHQRTQKQAVGSPQTGLCLVDRLLDTGKRLISLARFPHLATVTSPAAFVSCTCG